MNPPLRLEVSQPVLDFFEMEKIRHIERYTEGKFQASELDITYPVAWGKEAIEARLASLCAQAEDAVRSGTSIIIISDRKVEPRARRHSRAARAFGDPPAPGRQGPAHLDRPGGRDRLGARGAPLRAARRLRRRGGASVPRAGDAARARRAGQARRGRRRQEGDQELRQGDRQGPEEGDVQDGHLDLHVLHRRADLRGGGPVAHAGRQVLHRHHLQRRGHRPVRGRRGGDPRAPRGVRRARSGARRARSTPAASTPGACAARSTCGRRTRSPSCSTRRASRRRYSRPTRSTRRSSTTSRRAT